MPTDNHDFRQPPRGQQNWDQDWYHNFDTLDERVVARGLDADRSEYTPYQNALFLATDTENIYRGTGNGWEQLESYGVNPEFGQATADKVTLNNEPTNPNDAARLQDVESSGGGGTEPGLGGTYSTTGDGTSTTFRWDTGIDDPSAIEYVSIDPSSRSASTDYTRFIDGTNIGVEYDVAPDDGVTLSWFWTVNATIESITVEDHDHSGDTINPDVVNAQTATVSTPPSADTDVVRNIDLEDISGGAPDDHDHTGDTLNPDAVNAQSASVANAPTSETDVARQSEITTLDSEKADQSAVEGKADQDGGGTASLSNYGSVDADVLHSTTEPIVSVKAHGAVGDASADDTQAIQDAIAHLPADGGTVYFPRGTYRTTAPITIQKRNVRLVGNGRRNVQSADYVLNDLGPDTPPTIIPDHVDEAVVVDCSQQVNGFGVRGVTFYGLAFDERAAAGISFQIEDSFRRDFLIEDATISRFSRGIEITRSSTSDEPGIGMLRILNCNIMQNTQMLECTDDPDAIVNKFVMKNCDAGQNGYGSGGGIRIRGSALTIEDNVLEGQRDPVVCEGAYQNASIKGNYFEANTGEACIQFIDYRGPFDIGPNYYGDVSQNVEHSVTIYNNARGGSISDTYWPRVAHNTEWPTLHPNREEYRLNTDSSDHLTHTKRPTLADSRTLGDKLLNDRVTVDTANDPVHSTPFGDLHVKELDTSSEARVSQSDSWGPSVGDWVGFTSLLKTNVSVTPTVQFLMDASPSAPDSYAQQLYGYTRAHANSDWALVTAAARIGESDVDRPYMYLYPHGVSPSETGTAYVTVPYLWHVSNVNDIQPHFPADEFR